MNPLGFDLQQGERLLYAKRPDLGGDKFVNWFLGIIFAPLLFGWYFIYMAVTMEGRRPRLHAVTTWRFVVVEAKGEARSFWFREFADLEPRRENVNVGGGGIVGGLISVAVSAGLDAMANKKQKADPKYWARCIGLVFTTHQGQKVSVDLPRGDGQQLGLRVAQVFLGGMGEQMPSVDPSRLPQRKPVPEGRGLQVLGGALALYFPFFINLAASIVFVGDRKMTSIATAVIAAGGLAVFIAGSVKAARSLTAQGWRASPVVPVVVMSLLALPFPGLGVARAMRSSSYDDDYKRYSASRDDDDDRKTNNKPKSSSSALGAGSSSATSNGRSVAIPDKVPAGGMSAEKIAAVFKQRGWTFKPPEPSESNFGLEWDFDAEGHSFVYYWEINDVTKEGLVRRCSIEPMHAVCVDGDTTTKNEVEALLKSIAKKALGPSPEAAITAAGYKIGDSPMKGTDFYFGHRTHLFFPAKGETSLTVNVLDYSEAAQGKKQTLLRVDGRKVLIVSNEFTDDKTEVPSLTKDIAGK
ncbi:MAG: hypothetical protein U0271_45240 [Polyangiaceae bacterium]